MPKKRPTPEQIVTLLRQIEVATSKGKSVAIACRDAEISDQSYRDEVLVSLSSVRPCFAEAYVRSPSPERI
jgi:hypothetical protein